MKIADLSNSIIRLGQAWQVYCPTLRQQSQPQLHDGGIRHQMKPLQFRKQQDFSYEELIRDNVVIHLCNIHIYITYLNNIVVVNNMVM